MSKRTLDKKKQQSLNTVATNKKRGANRIALYTILPLAGTLIGWFAHKPVEHSKPSASMAEITATIKGGAPGYKFINPYVNTTVYDSIENKELGHFKHIITGYCEQAKKDPNIKQISYYFRDLSNGFWFGIDEKEKFIPASLSKVPIMIAVFMIAQKNHEYLNKKITYRGSVAQSYLKAHPEIDDTRTIMTEDSSYTVEELINLMIIKSDNEAALLLAYDFGKAHWDAFQNRLGKSVSLEAPQNGNVLTVKGYSSFFRMLYNASLLNREYSNKALEILSRSEYHYGIREAVPAEIKVAHKYGERDTLLTPTKLNVRQLHHAGIVYYPGKTFFLCIMTRGDNKGKLQKTISELARITYNEVDRQVQNFKQEEFDKDLN